MRRMTGRLNPTLLLTRIRRSTLAVSPDRWRTIFLALLAAATLITALRYVAKASKPSDLGTYTRTAFLRWRPQVLELDVGTNIYRAFAYPNPPIMALVLRPFYELPPLTGALAWFALKAAMAAAMVVWTFRLISTHGPPLPDWAKALAIVLSLHPIHGDLSHGNVNLFIGFLVLATLTCYRRQWDVAAGVVLALAIACKVTPALFLPYFLWKRAWRLLAGAIVGLALWLAVVPSAVLGWDANRELLTSWFDVMVRPFAQDGKVTSEHPNQSLPGLSFRLFTREPSFVSYDEDDKPYGADYHTVIDLGPDTARLLVKLAMAAFGVAILCLCRWPAHRPDVPRGGLALAAEFAFITLGMLLFSERTWKHHAVTLILPFAVLTAALAANPGSRFRAFLIAVLAVVVTLMIVPSLLGGQLQDLALVYGSHTAAFALLAVAVAAVAARHKQIV
jgi:alpha-1,2-mannosyltransferase